MYNTKIINRLLHRVPLLSLGIFYFQNFTNRKNTHLFSNKHFCQHVKSDFEEKSVFKAENIEDLINYYDNKQSSIHPIVAVGQKYKDHPVRVIARSAHDYLNNRSFFKEFIGIYHFNNNIPTQQFSKDDLALIKTFVQNLDKIIDEFFIQVSIQISRNVKSIPFSPACSDDNRLYLRQLFIDIISNEENKVFPNSGTFFKVSEKYLDYPERFPFMKENGVFSNWPNNRIIYKNNDIVVIINEEDHIRFKVNLDENNRGKMTKKILYLFDFVHQLEKQIQFEFDEKDFGYLTTSPSNLGNGLYFIFKIRIKNDPSKIEKIEQAIRQHSPQIGFEFSSTNKESNENVDLTLYNTTSFYNIFDMFVLIVGLKEILVEN